MGAVIKNNVAQQTPSNSIIMMAEMKQAFIEKEYTNNQIVIWSLTNYPHC